jgi:hypothetical protein
LLGLMSPNARQANKISRVTFNLAFKSSLSVFGSPTSETVYQITNSYLAAFTDVLTTLGLEHRITAPTVFRAIMETFPEVARISAAQHGKSFTRARFAAVLQPISSQLTAAKFEKAATGVKDLSELLAKLIKKDFSI